MAQDRGESRMYFEKFLSKFTKRELGTLVKVWGKLDVGVDMRQPKRACVRNLAQCCKEHQLTAADMNELALLHFHERSVSRQWTVYTLNREHDLQGEKGAMVTPEELMHTFRHELSFLLPHDCCWRLLDGAVWIRIAVAVGKGTSVCFLVHFLDSDVLLATTMTSTIRQAVLQALQVSLRCGLIEEQQLNGRNVLALADLVLNQQSQGFLSGLRMGVSGQSPLIPLQADDGDPERVNDTSVARRLSAAEEEGLQKNADVFGSGPQPPLERVEFKLQTSFQGHPQYTDAFPCRVRFEGSNVLGGLRSLVPNGLVRSGLSSLLSDLPQKATNRFVITTQEDRLDSDVASLNEEGADVGEESDVN